MKELPLLACDSVALNLRGGRQTHHRVPMRPQPLVDERGFWYPRPPKDAFDPASAPRRAKHYSSLKHWLKGAALDHAPWQPGHVLYVRECWALVTSHPLDGGDAETIYRADYIKGNRRDWWNESRLFDGRWRPSIHMPKRAARTWLHVKRVWVERVQDISEKDARAEGAPMYVMGHGPITQADLAAEPGYWSPSLYRDGFSDMWESIYAGSWERNDWLWCCELELDRERSGVTT